MEFEHDIIREAVIADLPEAIGQRINHRAAMSLARMAAAPSGLLAIHYTAAGLTQLAYTTAIAAAEEAATLRSPADAEFYLRLAISKAPTAEERLLARAALVEHFCEFELFYEARGLLSSSPDVGVRLRPQTAQLLDIYRLVMDASLSSEELVSSLEMAWKASGEFADEDARLRLLRAIIGLGHNMGSPIARETLKRILNDAEKLGVSPEAAKFMACLARTCAVYEGGRAGLDLGNRAVNIAELTGERSALMLAWISRATVNMLLGNLRDAERDFCSCDALVEQPHLLTSADRLTINRSVLLIETCRAEEAVANLDRIVASHTLPDQLLIRGNLALAAFEMHDSAGLPRRVRDLRSINATLQVRWAELFADCMEAYWCIWNLRFDDAETIVARLDDEEQKHSHEAFGPDPSYAQALIADQKAKASVGEALKYLEASARAQAARNVIGELRLQLMHAKILARVDAKGAELERRQVISRCRTSGALTLLRQAETFSPYSRASS